MTPTENPVAMAVRLCGGPMAVAEAMKLGSVRTVYYWLTAGRVPKRRHAETLSRLAVKCARDAADIAASEANDVPMICSPEQLRRDPVRQCTGSHVLGDMRPCSCWTATERRTP